MKILFTLLLLLSAGLLQAQELKMKSRWQDLVVGNQITEVDDTVHIQLNEHFAVIGERLPGKKKHFGYVTYKVDSLWSTRHAFPRDRQYHFSLANGDEWVYSIYYGILWRIQDKTIFTYYLGGGLKGEFRFIKHYRHLKPIN